MHLSRSAKHTGEPAFHVVRRHRERVGIKSLPVSPKHGCRTDETVTILVMLPQVEVAIIFGVIASICSLTTITFTLLQHRQALVPSRRNSGSSETSIARNPDLEMAMWPTSSPQQPPVRQPSLPPEAHFADQIEGGKRNDSVIVSALEPYLSDFRHVLTVGRAGSDPGQQWSRRLVGGFVPDNATQRKTAVAKRTDEPLLGPLSLLYTNSCSLVILMKPVSPVVHSLFVLQIMIATLPDRRGSRQQDPA